MTPINGETKLLGVMGWPVSHTKSPLFQNAGLRADGVNAVYVPLPVAPENVGDAVRGLRALGFVGCNVTIPHKLAVMPFLDRLTGAASLIGAVNTIRIERDGSLTGENTDWQGIVKALQLTGGELWGKSVAIVGAGGAGRAAAVACHLEDSRRIIVLNRTKDRADELVDWLRDIPENEAEVHAATLEEGCDWENIDVVLQMSSIGMHNEGIVPVPVDRLPAHCHVLDAVYAPLETRFLREARERGLKTTDGLEMLLQQGIAAYEFWLGTKPNRDAMRAALAAVSK